MEVATRKGGGAALCDWVALLATLGGVALGTFIVLKSPDPVFQLHFGIIAVFSLLGAIFMARRVFSSTETMDLNAYSDNVVKYGTIATVLWAVVGFLVGATIAWQLVFPQLSFDLPWDPRAEEHSADVRPELEPEVTARRHEVLQKILGNA